MPNYDDEVQSCCIVDCVINLCRLLYSDSCEEQG